MANKKYVKKYLMPNLFDSKVWMSELFGRRRISTGNNYSVELTDKGSQCDCPRSVPSTDTVNTVERF